MKYDDDAGGPGVSRFRCRAMPTREPSGKRGYHGAGVSMTSGTRSVGPDPMPGVELHGETPEERLEEYQALLRARFGLELSR